MKKHILIYGLCGGILIAMLRLVEYRFLVVEHSVEIYGGLIALLGAAIALWPARGRRRGALVHTETDALKEAKYREIRDAELDHASGKLSDEDFALLDAELRREAVEILDREPV